MITSKQIIEAYETNLPGGIEIFFNPDRKELRQCGEDVRFTADADRKKLYVWDAHFANHRDVNQKIYGGAHWLLMPLFTGIARRNGSKYYVNESHELELGLQSQVGRVLLKEVLALDWSWVNKYMEINNFINHLKTRLSKPL